MGISWAMGSARSRAGRLECVPPLVGALREEWRRGAVMWTSLWQRQDSGRGTIIADARDATREGWDVLDEVVGLWGGCDGCELLDELSGGVFS